MQYTFFAATIRNSVESHVHDVFNSGTMVAGQITKAATEKGEKFPFVTVDLFEVVGRQAREMSGVDEMMWCPMVDVGEYDAWTNYSTENLGWLDQSIALYAIEPGHSLTQGDFQRTDTNYSISNPVPGTSISQGPWSPIWQISPPPTTSHVINVDMLAYETKILVEAIGTFRTGLMSKVIATPGQENVPPRCVVVHPIFESLFHKDTAEIVGHVYSMFLWEAYLVNLLPEGVSGITAVLTNNCGQSFTYSLNGTSVSTLTCTAIVEVQNRLLPPFFPLLPAFRPHLLVTVTSMILGMITWKQSYLFTRWNAISPRKS